MNKPKSITTTYHRSYNYGATLQAYALQQTLIGIGFDNRLLDFSRNPYEKAPLLSGKPKVDLARFVLKIYSAFHAAEKKRLVKSFDDFTDKYLLLTQKYDSVSELENSNLDAACFFTGSDQIFTLREPDFVVMRNMLDFVSSDAIKCSYAASLADYDLNNEEKEKLRYYLSGYDTVSLREETAKEYLESFVEAPYRVDVDPVFLLDCTKWREIKIDPEIGKDYILYFQVNSNSIAQNAIDTLKEKYQCPVVCLQTNPLVRIRADKVILDASPEEFIGWIDNAKAVITTSFHGTAFSILLHKEFYTLTKPNSNPIRMFDMLSLFGLKNRLIENAECVRRLDTIDWTSVDKKVVTNREESTEYLLSVFNKATNISQRRKA